MQLAWRSASRIVLPYLVITILAVFICLGSLLLIIGQILARMLGVDHDELCAAVDGFLGTGDPGVAPERSAPQNPHRPSGFGDRPEEPWITVNWRVTPAAPLAGSRNAGSLPAYSRARALLDLSRRR